jgi:hypothetical protein
MTSHPQKNSSETAEDCRDFLRTGRCKYGVSCKFNHPPNVQSGGGIKTPIDPSEPLFPVRLNEPVCQYYMKHGTCKFSQACKFHHPPQLPHQPTSSAPSNAMFTSRAIEQQHIVINSMGHDQGTSTMMLQFLPQRPDEPDCLYYLRNGTCKYGATCRYHHPVNHHQQRKSIDSQRRTQQQVVHLQGHVSGEGMIQYMHTQSGFQQQNSRVVSTSGGQHLLVTETPIQVMTMNNGTLQQVSVDDLGIAVGAPIGMSQHHVSSSSSMASSYDTVSSGLDFVGQGQGGWDRSKRSNSGGSLSAFAEAQLARQQTIHGSNRIIGGNDNSAQSRRIRAASFGSSLGSASDLSGYHDGLMGWSAGNVSQPSLRLSQERYVEGGHPSEQSRRQNQYSVREEIPHKGPTQDQARNTAMHRAPPRQSRIGNVDHGLSMMTSALLHMMDTPDDAAAKTYPSRISSSSTLNNSTSPPVTPRSGNIHSPQLTSMSMFNEFNDGQVPTSTSSPNLYQHGHQMLFSKKASADHQVRSESSNSLGYDNAATKSQDPSYAYANGSDHFLDSDPASDHRDWSLSWQGLATQRGGQDAQADPVRPHHRANGTTTHLSNVGLYFP